MKGITKLIIVLLNGFNVNAYTIKEFNPKFFWNRPPESKFSDVYIICVFRFLFC